MHRDGRGMFADALMKAYPLMPEEEGRLHDDMLRENFIERVFAYDDWMQNVAGDQLTKQSLLEFRATSSPCWHILNYRQLGPMLADLSEPLAQIAERYILALWKYDTERAGSTNAMQHCWT